MVKDPVDPASEQRYRQLFEHMPLCILVADIAVTPATVLEANPRAALVFGYSAAELVGMPAAQLLPDDAAPSWSTIVRRVQQGGTVTAESTGRRRDGSVFRVRVIAAPDPTDTRHMMITVEDITTEEQQRSEADAIDAERRRIAHEIHDGVAQTLAGLRFKAALWAHQAQAVPPDRRGALDMHGAMDVGIALDAGSALDVSAALDEMQAVLTAAIADLRRAIFALRPLDLESQGFFPALSQLVGDFGDQGQLAARLEVSGLPDALPAVYALPLFRIIQEGLNNVGQHARASSALVRLAVDSAGGVAASVRDNGRGFDPQQLGSVDRDGHFGLRQMRERVLDLGGTLDIISASGRGTELIITLPAVTLPGDTLSPIALPTVIDEPGHAAD